MRHGPWMDTLIEQNRSPVALGRLRVSGSLISPRRRRRFLRLLARVCEALGKFEVAIGRGIVLVIIIAVFVAYWTAIP